MSKKRQRLDLIHENVRKRPKGTRQPSPRLTWKDKFLICGAVLACLALMAVPFVISSINFHRDHFRQKVQRWQIKHGLSEARARKILEIELEFHGSGNPLWFRPARTDAEKATHRREIGELLGHEDPARFQETDAE